MKKLLVIFFVVITANIGFSVKSIDLPKHYKFPKNYFKGKHYDSVKDFFLIATEKINDSRFEKTVILMLEHDEKGAFGIAINKPLGKITLGSLISKIDDPVINKKGELVCKNSFPSMPTKFWNDLNNIKFKNAYFNKFKGVWHHGDYAEIKKSGGYVIYGRSDTTLNPGGVRLGTAEIYSVVEKFKEIKESLVVGQSWDNDIRIVLFVVMDNNYILNHDLIDRVKNQIRFKASPRHVPSKVISISDIPRTKNGKIVELAVKNTIEGNEIKNIQALANPEILKEYKNLKELKN